MPFVRQLNENIIELSNHYVIQIWNAFDWCLNYFLFAASLMSIELNDSKSTSFFFSFERFSILPQNNLSNRYWLPSWNSHKDHIRCKHKATTPSLDRVSSLSIARAALDYYNNPCINFLIPHCISCDRAFKKKASRKNGPLCSNFQAIFKVEAHHVSARETEEQKTETIINWLP